MFFKNKVGQPGQFWPDHISHTCIQVDTTNEHSTQVSKQSDQNHRNISHFFIFLSKLGHLANCGPIKNASHLSNKVIRMNTSPTFQSNRTKTARRVKNKENSKLAYWANFGQIKNISPIWKEIYLRNIPPQFKSNRAKTVGGVAFLSFSFKVRPPGQFRPDQKSPTTIRRRYT